MQVFTSFIVLGLCCTFFVITDVRNYKDRKAESISAIAQVLGSNTISAIQFLDTAAAMDKLSQLKIETDILNASILNKTNNVFASYTKMGAKNFNFEPTTNSISNRTEFSGASLFAYSKIARNEENLGTVCLRVELAELNNIIGEKVRMAIILFVIGVVFALMISIIFQRSISTPILNLLATMQQVTQSGNYKNRVQVKGDDEVNTLSCAFNTMLEEIEKREMHIKQRTAELETANKEMESFSYSVSHDLRAPIRAINGFSKIIEKKHTPQLDDEGKNLLNTISEEATRMGRLIDDLLAFSRLGKKEIQKAKIDMTELAKEVINEILKLEAEKYKAIITIDQLSSADCDRVLIKQVFVNLISNALKFSFQNPEPAIHIGSYSEPNSIVYYIRDNGVGFDMKFYDKLFGVFQRLHNPDEFPGTGIGLAIVKRIIIRHGGKVWAVGKVNQGATFYFSLPDNTTNSANTTNKESL